MNDLAGQRCFNHAHREAAAVCTECGRYFCRECIAEHDDRIFCAACLKASMEPSFKKRFRFGSIVRIGQCLLGFLILWLFFYYLGQTLSSLPSSFHEGTVWKSGWKTGK